MARLFNADSGEQIGEIDDAQLQFLIGQME